jgi:thiamine-monophosphate kinase
VRHRGEFALIDRFTRGFRRPGEGVLVGIGDDAAVLAPPPGEQLVATVDAVVEGVHFGPGFRPAEVGWKSLAVNLSDLAAMGARPLWALVGLATPRGEDRARLGRMGDGLADCARRFGVAVVGGNVTAARDLSLTVTVVGSVRPGAALLRSGGRPGDLLLVSGTLGDAALGLAPGAAPALRRRQRRPQPRLALGQALSGVARAAIDVSDGLLQDLGHLCEASGTGAVVELPRLPLSAEYRRATRGRADAFEAALGGGEDYELLVAVAPARLEEAQAAARAAGVPLTEVGRLTRRPGTWVVKGGGGRYRPRRAGHDHLRARSILGRGRPRA